jgi:hypothetical protein
VKSTTTLIFSLCEVFAVRALSSFVFSEISSLWPIFSFFASRQPVLPYRKHSKGAYRKLLAWFCISNITAPFFCLFLFHNCLAFYSHSILVRFFIDHVKPLSPRISSVATHKTNNRNVPERIPIRINSRRMTLAANRISHNRFTLKDGGSSRYPPV